MKKRNFYLLSVATIVGLSCFSGGLIFPDTSLTASGKFSEGEEIYSRNCGGCHPQGRNIVNPSIPLAGSAKLKDLDTFSKFVRNPVKSDGSKGSMPPFVKETVSDKEMEQLYGYATTLTGK